MRNCVGIPSESVLALTQMVDGYDKPVNGVLSHTFVKGAYANMVLKKQVNWAAYASTKLKSQILQWERDGKGKPNGPPCVRKPRTHLPPPSKAERNANVNLSTNGNKEMPRGMENAIVEFNASLPAISTSTDVAAVAASLDTNIPVQDTECHLLLAILRSEILKMRSHEQDICSRLHRVDQSLSKLQIVQREGVSTENTLSEQCKSLEVEMKRLQDQLTNEESLAVDVVSDIEGELNKQSEEGEIGEVNTELVALLEAKQKNKEEAIENLKSLLEVTKKDLHSTRGVIAVNQKKLSDVPKTIQKLIVVCQTLEADKAKIDANLLAQQTEWSILSPILTKPCPPLHPTFTVTSAQIAQTNYTLSSCPVCCFGYHEFNWIPASCGHAYHPACLFPLISNSKMAPKCISCAELFKPEWLRLWGLQWTWEGSKDQTGVITDDMVMNLKATFGKNASRLQHRRLIAANLNKEQAKGNFQLEAEDCVQSLPPSSVIDVSDEACEDGSSKIGDVTIQVNEELGMKLMGMSGEYFRAECDGRGNKIREVCARAISGFWTISYVIEERGVCRALSVVKPEEAGPSTSQDKVKGKARTILKEKEPECRVDSGLRGRFRVTSRLQVDELGDNFSAELVTSLKSFRIKEEQ
ncbi:unnamed protein product [Calypogeia fissa]